MKKELIQHLPTRLYLELKWWDFKLTQPCDHLNAKRRRKEEFNGYSLSGFVQKKAIFIHIPKCAGISVSKSLFANLGGGHNTLEDYTLLFSPAELVRFFKFTFVRNPFDRLVSAYFFLKKGGITEFDRSFFSDNIAQFESFDDFIKNWLNKKNIWKGQHFRPQYHYIRDKRDRITVDFVGRFENLNDDFAYICEKLNTPNDLIITNRSDRHDYQTYYTDETRKIVESVYERDLDEFNYKF